MMSHASFSNRALAIIVSNDWAFSNVSLCVSFIPRPISSLFQPLQGTCTFESKVSQVGMYLFNDFGYHEWRGDNLGDRAGVPLFMEVSAK